MTRRRVPGPHRPIGPPPPPPGPGSDPEPDREHPAVLLLRVWHQGDDLRCRLITVTDASSPAGATAAQGIDAICDEVRRWLSQV